MVQPGFPGRPLVIFLSEVPARRPPFSIFSFSVLPPMPHDHDVSRILRRWYATHRRALPWRDTRDPYRIWISEVILQQTRVAQGMDYYRRFLERFPDVRALADAAELAATAPRP